MFVGNVVTSRINFDRIEWNGATPVAKELPDFLVSKDLWFRPVDIKLGPDGALYVADFYNKIIGHYEVDLKHPGRDKDRGRALADRVEGQGRQRSRPKFAFTDLTKETTPSWSNLLGDPNLTVRLAGDEPTDPPRSEERRMRQGHSDEVRPTKPCSRPWPAYRRWVADVTDSRRRSAWRHRHC